MTTTEMTKLSGIYSLHDVKYDILKIIEPYDGYMYNRKDTERVRSLVDSYLSDLKNFNKIVDYNIYSTVKDTAITFDVSVKIYRDRSPKRLKIHVGTLQYTPYSK
jgi:hypothetical protein